MQVSNIKENRSKGDYGVAQGFRYIGDDYWDWWLWIEARDENLDKIDNVIYNLHSTFKNPVRIVNTRENKFRLETAGWGTFTIYIRVNFKDKTVLQLEHMLVLSYPLGEQNKG